MPLQQSGVCRYNVLMNERYVTKVLLKRLVSKSLIYIVSGQTESLVMRLQLAWKQVVQAATAEITLWREWAS